MNPFLTLIGLLYVGAAWWAWLDDKWAWMCVYLLWGGSSFLLAYLEAR